MYSVSAAVYSPDNAQGLMGLCVLSKRNEHTHEEGRLIGDCVCLLQNTAFSAYDVHELVEAQFSGFQCILVDYI